MHRGTERDVDVIPLQNAVLCVDCESVSNSRCAVCPTCGSRSIFNLFRMLGGTLFGQEAKFLEDGQGVLKFDLEITIRLKGMEARDLNTAVEGITRLIAPKLDHTGASFHIKVEPVRDNSREPAEKAA